MGQMPTIAVHEATGREVVLYGRLQYLRDRLGLTKSAMATLMSLSPQTYTKCEDPGYAGKMWNSTAERVGRYYWLIHLQLDQLELDGVELDQLLPLPVVAQYSGMPQEILMKWYRDGVIAAEDLGVLGLWIYRDDLDKIGEARST